MEHQGQHDHAAKRVDEYGNPVAGHGTTGDAMGAHGAGGQLQAAKEEQKTRGILHRSGSSSSSSSSSDDGMGGSRKKGIKEKIKEKLPGGNKANQQPAPATGGAYGQQGHAGVTGTAGNGAAATGEKKGIMEKVKEKLPGKH